MLYSIAITTYECNGLGPDFIKRNLDSISSQTYRPIQCVISDHSKNDDVKNVVYSIDMNGIELIYTRYTEHYGNPCYNWTNALRLTTGEYIQYLAMDDRFAYDNSIKDTIEFITQNNPKWIACAHQTEPSGDFFIPKWNPYILYGGNTISGPSAVVLHKSLKHIQLDPNFTWFLDIEWYYRLYLEAGMPSIFEKYTWINCGHPNQLSNTVCDTGRRQLEYSWLIEKYGNPLPIA